MLQKCGFMKTLLVQKYSPQCDFALLAMTAQRKDHIALIFLEGRTADSCSNLKNAERLCVGPHIKSSFSRSNPTSQISLIKTDSV